MEGTTKANGIGSSGKNGLVNDDRSNGDRKPAGNRELVHRIHDQESAWRQSERQFESLRQERAGTTYVLVEYQNEEPLIRPRLGWSIAIASVANVILGLTAILTGATIVGVVACSGLSIATCGLVLAEIGSRCRFDQTQR